MPSAPHTRSVGHVAASLGVEIQDSDQPYDYRIHFFLLWDYADGPFWKGWR